jgi:hypothetical protein
MDNAQKHNICTDVPSSQILDMIKSCMGIPDTVRRRTITEQVGVAVTPYTFIQDMPSSNCDCNIGYLI